MEEIKTEVNSSIPSTNEILMEAITSANSITIDSTNDIKENIFDGGGISSTNEENETKIFQEQSTVSSTTAELITVTTVGHTQPSDDQMVTVTYVESSDISVSDMDQVENENTNSIIENEPLMDHEIAIPVHDNNENVDNGLLSVPEESEEIVTAEKIDEPEIQIVSETVVQTKPKPTNTNILHSYILNNQNKGKRPINIGPKQSIPTVATSITVPVTLPNQLTGATMVAIPQTKGAGPKKIVILPPPNAQNFSPNSIQRCIIRPQSGMQIPQLIFIPNATTSTGITQVQNMTTAPAIGGAPLVMTSCLRPNITQTQVRNSGPLPQIRSTLIQTPTAVTSQIRPIRATYSNKIRAVTPTTSSNTTNVHCEKCKSPLSGQVKALPVQKKKDNQTQTPSQTFRSNNTAPLISAMQQRCKKYNQAARAFKAKIKRLEAKVDSLQKQVKAGGKPIKTIENVIKASKPYLSETAHDLFRLLLCSEPGKSSTCTRYADCTKDFALSLYCCSKTAYRVCQSVFKLPTPHGLMRKTRNISDKPSSSGASENMDILNQVEEEEVVIGGENGEDEEFFNDQDEIGDDMVDDDEELDEDDIGEDDEKNEDDQAVTEVVELMHCEPEVGFDAGQFEIIIPDSQRT